MVVRHARVEGEACDLGGPEVGAQVLVADALVVGGEGDLAAQQELEALARGVAPAHVEPALRLRAPEALAVVEAARAGDRVRAQIVEAAPVEAEIPAVEE